MTLHPNAARPEVEAVREALLAQAVQVGRLEAACAGALRGLERQPGNRQRLLLRLLLASLERYRLALKAEGANVAPPPPTEGVGFEAVVLACAELRDRTWAAWQVVLDSAAGSARFLESQALELEFVLRAADYLRQSDRPQAPVEWLGRRADHAGR